MIELNLDRNNPPPKALGVFTDRSSISCYFSSQEREVGLARSEDGNHFELVRGQLPLKANRRIHVSKIDLGQVAVFTSPTGELTLAYSSDLYQWIPLTQLKQKKYSDALIVPHFQLDGKYLMLLAGRSIAICLAQKIGSWDTYHAVTLNLDLGDSSDRIELDFAQPIESGILVCFRTLHVSANGLRHQVRLAILDRNGPERVLWQSPSPIWESDPKWGKCSSAGAVLFHSGIYGFWNTEKLGMVQVHYPVYGLPFSLPINHKIALTKSKLNPIIAPRSDYPWEAFSTFNPAAFLADGKVHILYRAQSQDLLSSIGYASSSDGVTIEERSERPIYLPQEVFECINSVEMARQGESESLGRYRSGGGIAGCEDPRVTVIDNTVYMTYVAFDGANPPRIALTSIDLEDFLAKRWLWQKPVLISPPGIVDKSAVIFPEKIKGKYVIMHRIFPDILIDFVDDLHFDGHHWLRGEFRIPVRENHWDSRKIGAGAPPLRTSEGWLLIYYGVDDRDDRFYKIGAMLLDLEDPTHVLLRSESPILEPEEWYESSGFKPGVAYPCGAVILGNDLLVYYGGADSVVCVAKANLSEFLSALKDEGELRLTAAETQRIQYDASYSCH